MKDWDFGDWIVTVVIIIVAIMGIRSCSESSGGGGRVDYEQYDSGPDCFESWMGGGCQ